MLAVNVDPMRRSFSLTESVAHYPSRQQDLVFVATTITIGAVYGTLEKLFILKKDFLENIFFPKDSS